MRGSAPGGSSQAAAARRCGTIGASWRSRGVAPGALATVGAAEAPILEWRRAVLKRVALHTVSGAQSVPGRGRRRCGLDVRQGERGERHRCQDRL